MIGYLAAAASVLLVSFAQLAMRWGMVRLPPPAALATLDASHALPLALVVAGLGAYALSLAAWMVALSKLPLHRAYPLLSVSYALVYLLAATLPWFDGSFTLPRSAGVLLVVCGVLLTNAGRERRG